MYVLSKHDAVQLKCSLGVLPLAGSKPSSYSLIMHSVHYSVIIKTKHICQLQQRPFINHWCNVVSCLWLHYSRGKKTKTLSLFVSAQLARCCSDWCAAATELHMQRAVMYWHVLCPEICQSRPTLLKITQPPQLQIGCIGKISTLSVADNEQILLLILLLMTAAFWKLFNPLMKNPN